jgi:hypothetical protein
MIIRLFFIFTFSLLLSACVPQYLRNKPFTDGLNEMTSAPSFETADPAEPRVNGPKFPSEDIANDPPGPYDIIDSSLIPGALDCQPEKSALDDLIDFAEAGEEIGSNAQRGDTYKFYQTFLDAGVPKIPLEKTLDYYEKNKSKFTNKNFISIADYSQNSRQKRFYILDMRTGNVTKEKVSHGSGHVPAAHTRPGDPDGDGMLDRCDHKNIRPGQPGKYRNMTRPGFFKTGELYKSAQKWPTAIKKENGVSYNGMRMDGLEERNKGARNDGVVMHEAYYNSTEPDSIMGRSYGCPSFAPGRAKEIFSSIKEGALFYAHAPQCE